MNARARRRRAHAHSQKHRTRSARSAARAPMNAPEISTFARDTTNAETLLENLIERYGYEKVCDDLAALIPRSQWSTYQRVANLARSVHLRMTLQKAAK